MATDLEKLKGTKSLTDLAILLGYKPKALSYILYKIPTRSKYTLFTIPKKNGGDRSIKAPIDQLKKLQKRLAKLLNNCFEHINFISKPKRSISHGFRKNHSILTNAINHRNKRYVFNLDLRDFFPSINLGRVRGFLIKNAHFELDPKVATVISQIACHDNEIPQGSPCSPVISNLIGHLLDMRLVSLAKKTKCTYSRYADDLTFSTNQKDFPERIAVRKEPDGTEWVVGKALKKEIESVGFAINETKTSMQYKTTRQMATGLVVNEKINIRKEYYEQARSMCHALFQNDTFFIRNINIPEPPVEKSAGAEGVLSADIREAPKGDTPAEKEPGTLKQLEGILGYIYQIKNFSDKTKFGERKHDPHGIRKLYRAFLFYEHFFSLKRPLIVCEGKTDIVYLKCALLQLQKEFGELIQSKEGKVEFKIGFLRMSKNMKEVLAMSEGTSGLAWLMEIYKKHIELFKGNGKMHPVIILVDNDSGSKDIKKKLDVKDLVMPFYKYIENLYVVPIPPDSEGKERMIENLFDKKTLETKLKGKTFNPNPKVKDIDPNTEYGKIVFAEKVVKPNQNEINFDGFKEVLNRFQAVIKDYKKRI